MRKAALHQLLDRLFPSSTRPDQCDDFVDVADREDQPLQTVGLFLGFAKEVLGAASNDVDPVIDPERIICLMPSVRGRLRSSRDVDDRHRRLKRCRPVELLLDHIWIRVLLQVDDDSGPMRLAGEVLDVGDAVDPTVLAASTIFSIRLFWTT